MPSLGVWHNTCMREMERARRRYEIVEVVAHLRPQQYALVADPEQDLKLRWKAFDALYELFYEEVARRGYLPEQLDSPEWYHPHLSLDHQRRLSFAYEILLLAWGHEAAPLVPIEAEKLVPQPPDLNTGLPAFTFGDVALLHMLCNAVREEMPAAWERFFQYRTAPLEQVRAAFEEIATVVIKAWQQQSLAPLRFNEAQRKKLVILALTSFQSDQVCTQDEIEWLMRVLVDGVGNTS
ncbi:MAG: hypothetical protein NZM10_03130 [Fimbriimonadales bacterium]|nr:hypothetical protein [Fimbriimonadales bacterium]